MRYVSLALYEAKILSIQYHLDLSTQCPQDFPPFFPSPDCHTYHHNCSHFSHQPCGFLTCSFTLILCQFSCLVGFVFWFLLLGAVSNYFLLPCCLSACLHVPACKLHHWINHWSQHTVSSVCVLILSLLPGITICDRIIWFNPVSLKREEFFMQ